MTASEDLKRYGWCKRTGAWVARDDMLGMHVKIFAADGTEEHVTIRLHPEAHRNLAAEVRSLAWVNDLRTRAELEAEGAPIAEVDAGATDTAAWYGQRRSAEEDNRVVARALMRTVLRARDMDELEGALARVAERASGEALFEAMQEARSLVPRWDENLVEIALFDDKSATSYTDLAVSADDGEVLFLRLDGEGKLRVLRADHDRSEAIMRARGKLREGPRALTR
jgi:hypothetical protein